MKKFLKCCGIAGIIGLSLIGSLQVSAYGNEDWDDQTYTYVPDFYFKKKFICFN